MGSLPICWQKGSDLKISRRAARWLPAALLFASATPCFADVHFLAGIKCNPQTDRLIVYFMTAKDGAGKEMIARKNANEWQPADLILPTQNEQHVGEMTTASRDCTLTHGRYVVTIGPAPGNINPMGHCGSELTAWVEIRRDSRIILPRRKFAPVCNEKIRDVTTRIVIDARSSGPRITAKAEAEFYR